MLNVRQNLSIRWLILIRLLLTTVLFSIGHIVFDIEKEAFYFLIAGVYLISIVFALWLGTGKALGLLIYIQLIFDILLETLIVAMTGGAESIFSVLYIFSIMAASFILVPRAGIITALIVGFLYAACSIWLPLLFGRAVTVETVYKVYVHFVTFALIGILLFQLAKRLFQMEEKVKLKEHLAIVGELSSQLAHEIRNPLASISGSAELLKERLGHELKEKDLKLMEAVVSESERIHIIFEGFLNYSRMSDDRIETASIGGLLSDLVLLFKNHPNIKDTIEIKTLYDENNCHINCDSVKIKQVFANIMWNAFEAMSQGGLLEIDFVEREKEVEVLFRDSGEGISRKELKSLFDRKKSKKHAGLPIGLLIADRIVKMHKGRIEVESEEQIGTVFKVILPKVGIEA